MMNEAKNYKVTIFGEQYSLVSDEPANQVIQSAAFVDALMNELASKLKNAEPKKIAVLAALQLANQVIELEQSHQKNATVMQELVQRIDQGILSVIP
jgi:cell division protein ZapA